VSGAGRKGSYMKNIRTILWDILFVFMVAIGTVVLLEFLGIPTEGMRNMVMQLISK
jgi:hypothetical protein